MIYIQGQLLTSFRDAKSITLTVKTLPSFVISAVRQGVGLAEFEHAKIAVRRPAHGKMLARGLRIAQTSLQRIAVKQSTATRRLKRFGGYLLSQFVDIGARGTDFGLQYFRRCPPSADFRPTPRQRLHCQCPRRLELHFDFAQCCLELRLRGQWCCCRDAAALADCLGGDFVECPTRYSQRDAHMKCGKERRKAKPKHHLLAGNNIAVDCIHYRKCHVVRDEYVIDAVIAAAGASQSRDLPIVMDCDLFARQHSHPQSGGW